MLEQLTDVVNHVAESLDIVNGGMGVAEKLSGAMGSVRAARDALRGTQMHRLFPYHVVDPRVCFLSSDFCFCDSWFTGGLIDCLDI